MPPVEPWSWRSGGQLRVAQGMIKSITPALVAWAVRSISTINGFNPTLGQSFVFMTATAGFTSTFASVKYPAAPAGLKWDLIYSANQLVAQLADVIDITSLVVNGSASNLNRSGIGTLRFNFDQPVTIASPTNLILRNHTTGNTVSIAGATLTGNGTNSITWNLASVVLADGRYTVELPASQVLNAADLLFCRLPGTLKCDHTIGRLIDLCERRNGRIDIDPCLFKIRGIASGNLGTSRYNREPEDRCLSFERAS